MFDIFGRKRIRELEAQVALKHEVLEALVQANERLAAKNKTTEKERDSAIYSLKTVAERAAQVAGSNLCKKDGQG